MDHKTRFYQRYSLGGIGDKYVFAILQKICTIIQMNEFTKLYLPNSCFV